MSTVIIAVGAHTAAENLPEQAVTKLYDMEEAKSTVGTIYHRFGTEVISVVHRWRKHGGLSPANRCCRATVNCYKQGFTRAHRSVHSIQLLVTVLLLYIDRPFKLFKLNTSDTVCLSTGTSHVRNTVDEGMTPQALRDATLQAVAAHSDPGLHFGQTVFSSALERR